MVLELGRAGTAGAGKGVIPLLADGRSVATLQAANWKEQATAVVGEREWALSKRKGELRGRWTVDPEDSARLRARQVSSWRGTWVADLEGARVEVQTLSHWRGTHRFVSGGMQVGHSGTTGGWSPRPTLTATPQMPLDHQVFLLWLELVVSRRNTAVMAGAVGVAVIGGSS